MVVEEQMTAGFGLERHLVVGWVRIVGLWSGACTMAMELMVVATQNCYPSCDHGGSLVFTRGGCDVVVRFACLAQEICCSTDLACLRK